MIPNTDKEQGQETDRTKDSGTTRYKNTKQGKKRNVIGSGRYTGTHRHTQVHRNSDWSRRTQDTHGRRGNV
jgi:hypothetical protein